ncbi:MAG: glycosyltransferase family 4 protein, partial [Longimicrobiales bacterium]
PVPDSVTEAGITPLFFHVPAGSLLSAARAARVIRKLEIGTLYLSDRRFRDPSYFIYRLAGVSSILSHDHTPGDRPEIRGVRRWAKAFLNSIGSITCDAWIAISPLMKTRAELNGVIPSSRCAVVQNGIDPVPRSGEIRLKAREELGLSERQFAIATVGRASFYKGIDFVVQVAAALRDAGRDDVVFFHLGDGPDLESFNTLAKDLGLGPTDFRFEGNRPDVRTLLPGFDAAIHASKGEGFSLAILEYMSAGLPTLVPDVPSVCQAVEDGKTGLIYQAGNVASASGCIRRLATDPELRERLGQASAQAVDRHYSWDRTREEFNQLLDRWL